MGEYSRSTPLSVFSLGHAGHYSAYRLGTTFYDYPHYFFTITLTTLAWALLFTITPTLPYVIFLFCDGSAFLILRGVT